MRIALVAAAIPDYSTELLDIASKIGDVALYISDKHYDAIRPRPRIPGQIRWSKWPRQRQPLRNILFARNLCSQIRRWNADIVHVLSMDPWVHLLPRMLSSTPFISTVHDVKVHPGDINSQRMPRSLINLLIRQCDGIIVHGEQLRVAAEIALPVHPANIYTFPHPPLIHYSEIAKQRGFAKPNDGIFRVLFFGRICEYKGLKYLLDTIPLVHACIPFIRFVIAGQGDDLSNYGAWIRSLDYVQIHNRYISLEECALLFFEADLVVLPYIEASQSGVLMIAMAFGLPVVVTDVGEMATTVRSTGMGILIPPRDTTALASAIIDVAHDNHLRQELSTRAKTAISHEYSREVLSYHLLQIYEAVLNRRTNCPMHHRRHP